MPQVARPGRAERPPAALLPGASASRTAAGQTRDRSASASRATGPRPCRCRRAPSTPASLQPAKVDKYQTVRFDSNRYSVPRRCAFQTVTVKGYVDRVEVVADGQVVARHAAQLRPATSRSRSAALPGDAGAQAGGAGPRPGLPRLATARRLRRAAAGPGAAARPAAGAPALHPRAATAGRAPARRVVQRAIEPEPTRSRLRRRTRSCCGCGSAVAAAARPRCDRADATATAVRRRTRCRVPDLSRFDQLPIPRRD